MSYLIYLFGSFHIGYLVLAPIFLIGRLIRHTVVRNESTNLLSAINLAFAIGLIFEMILFAVELFISYWGSAKYEGYWFGRNPHDQLYYMSMCLIYTLAILFLFKRFRKSWILTLLMLVLLNSDYLFSFLIKFFRDYLPSAWTTYYHYSIFDYILKTLIFGAFSFIVYFLLVKFKKLPYPPALIR